MSCNIFVILIGENNFISSVCSSDQQAELIEWSRFSLIFANANSVLHLTDYLEIIFKTCTFAGRKPLVKINPSYVATVTINMKS